jgi:hypothetical protein
MKTDELIAMLATGPSSTAELRQSNARQFAWQLTAGGAAALVLMVLVFGVRTDVQQAMALPMFWFKLLFTAVLAGTGLWGLRRLTLPGKKTASLPLAVAFPVLLLWAAATAALLSTPSAQWSTQLLGTTWNQCPVNIALLAVPGLWLALRSAKLGAPTRLRATGAAAGLLAGSVAAFFYAWHCPEMAVPFLAVWYVLGIAIPTLAGALLGSRVLRW